jgi:hypothetical protein
MIVERGFAQPPSYHEERLRTMPIGYFYDVASNGYGLMSGYKAQIKPHDRWAIAAWIRVLQRARFAPIDGLSAEERRLVMAAADGAGDPGSATSAGEHAASASEAAPAAESLDDDHASAAAHEAGAL